MGGRIPYNAQHAVVFYSGHNPCPCQGEVPLCVTLDVGVGVSHGRNQHVKQDHDHNEQEDEVQQDTQPPADRGQARPSAVHCWRSSGARGCGAYGNSSRNNFTYY